MIKIENTEVYGLKAAIRGMRNPMNSWEKSDSYFDNINIDFKVGNADLDLMKRLAKSGTEHAKFMRYINVTVDLTAPLYWYKEMDCYRIGVEHNSCSTMHKIASNEFTIDDFSTEHLSGLYVCAGDGSCDYLVNSCDDFDFTVSIKTTLIYLNIARNMYLKTKDKQYWWQMIQLLPSSYNQRRTYQFSYQALAAIYKQRKGHKLDEWQTFREWIESLPYSELITGGKSDV